MRKLFPLLCILAAQLLPLSRGEVILQYFQMPWRSLTQKMPELAEAGYSALWLPPPTKGSGGLSVGYDLWDPFDLGDKDQRNTVRTFYGTRAELEEMVATAHRFGIRVYFDNIMNHRAFDVPGFNETTPIDVYPGMRPEDFHLRVTEDGFYRKWDNTRDWNDEWQVQHLGLSDLIDIAHEVGLGGWNHNHGPTEGSHHPGIQFVRHPDNPEYYAHDPTGAYVGFGNVTQAMLDNNPGAYTEDVNAYLIRAVRWLMHVTKADGLRLDAVKHVPAYFFGQQQGADKDESTAGYLGGMQLQYKLTRGYSDSNLRDSVFDINIPRDDAMAFGEHLGQPPAFQSYIDAGMRLKNAPLRDQLNGFLGQPWGDLSGMDQPGFSGHPAFNQHTGVTFPHSHDSDFSSARELQYGYYMTRQGLPIVYTDGYFKAGTLQDSGGAFPRHANTNFLGQFADNRLPNLAYVREHFARGGQVPHWADGDVVAYSRVDPRHEGWTGSGLYKSLSDADAAVMLFMMNDNFADGQARPIQSAFPSTPGGPDAYLYNYSTYGGGFYVWASDIAAGNAVIPPGGYFIFSWRSPEASNLWKNAGGHAISIYQDGEEPEWIRVTRRDGPNGDEQFNPRGLPNRGYPAGESPEPFRYRMPVPRITSGDNLRFVARVDGSAANVLMKLNGGVDLNNHLGMGNQTDVGRRDRPPALSTDTFLGWEDTQFLKRIGPEKFAAADAQRSLVGSAGAETYEFTVGTAGHTPYPAPANNDLAANGTAAFLYHDPEATTDEDTPAPQFTPAPDAAAGQPVTLRVKVGNQFDVNRVFLYYTTDGETFPEGAGGEGLNGTRTVELAFRSNVTEDGETRDWWEGDLPALSADTVVRYKIGGYRHQDGSTNAPWDVPFPSDQNNVDRKTNMMGVWEIPSFDATTIEYFPHNDWAVDSLETGLQEGFNFIQARAFLERDFRAPIYNTFKQTFYLDLEPPSGEIKFPTANETLPSSEYGGVVRTDSTVTEVWVNILDSDPNNDDDATGIENGNGPDHWVRASEVTPGLSIDSPFPREWRFTYRNIPSSGQATVRVRLREISSSSDFQLSDAQGHTTTLEQTVTTSGPAQELFVAWPQQDGDTVGEGYELKAYFSKSLADGTTPAQLIDRFTVRIDNTAQGKDGYEIRFNETDDFHALVFPLPQLFNGDPDYLHQIEVEHVTGPGVRLSAFREVRAFPVAPAPSLQIVDPEQFDSNGRQTVIVLPDIASPDPADRQYEILVTTDLEFDDVWLDFADLLGGAVTLQGVEENDTQKQWTFLWEITTPGTYVFHARGSVQGAPGQVAAEDFRSIPVVFRQVVDEDGSFDSDNDGIPDTNEIEQTPLPETDSESWTNGDVHLWRITGRSNPLMPVTDGGGLPDGLQAGLQNPVLSAETDRAADTNGDGFTNFISDLDPPVFNTLDSDWHPEYNFQRSRTDLIGGTMTDMNRADTDNDGLRDDEEDLNRNGRVDIGLLGPDGKVETLLVWPDIPTVYNTSRIDRDSLPQNAVYLETDPNSADTIGDGQPDGQADLARNGRVDMYLLHEDDTLEPLQYTDPQHAHFAYNRMPNDPALLDRDNNNPPAWHETGTVYPSIHSRAVHYDALFAAYASDGSGTAQDAGGWPRLLITETDPLVLDTIGDGLPDGWKIRFGLDPLDDGVTNWRTGGSGTPVNGPAGDLTGDGVTNLDHFIAGTDPRVPVTGVAPPEDAITVGSGAELGSVNGVTRFEEFMDWTRDDLRAVDAYEGGGSNHQGGDIFPAYDGWDSSRDLAAFYSRDGGAVADGGDGRLYFRVDFHDLQAFAEQGNLDLYVAVNFGDPSSPLGERVLPDEIDTLTDMRWRAVVAVYESSLGTVYVDTDSGANTDTFGQDLGANGVVSRPGSFLGAHFNSELDAVEFAIDRQALLDAGWLGLDPADLRFQVYTTKSGTQNDPQGPGDLGGRGDIRDAIFNDSIAEDHWAAQQGLQGTGSVLRNWIPGDHRGGRVHVALVLHGNQQIQPGHTVQDLVNNNAGAGYYRPIDAHAAYAAPLNLHITPTLATAIQWAAVDPDAEQPWRDGPAFNARLADLMTEGVIQPLGTTFSDHIPAYFDLDYNQNNVDLAHDILERVYGVAMDDVRVFYPPERVLDGDTFGKIRDLGFDYTLADQMTHFRDWFGREAALGPDGFRVNRVHDVATFAINDRVSATRFDAHDAGAGLGIRRQLNRMARNGVQDQVLVIHSSWEDFLDTDNADAYDALVRWLSNRAWVNLLTLEDIAHHRVDLDGDGSGDAWWQIDRGAPTLPKTAKEWIHYASRENYDNWYVGEPGFREGLQSTVFDIRPGAPLPQAYGMQAIDTGIVADAWNAVDSIQQPDLRRLAAGVLHASTFITAFHNQPSVDLRKFSTGEYINPDTEFRALADFARQAQAQTRLAAIYARVDQWAGVADTLSAAQTTAEDIDLDGENEYLLYNNRVFAMLERTGGRMTAAWVRHPDSGRVFQVVGNPLSRSGSDTEHEGTTHADAFRTSALKDWWAGTDAYVNQLYTFTPATDGWTATSADGLIAKTVTLDFDDGTFQVAYTVDSGLNGGKLFVRHGLTPDLFGLLTLGQDQLADEAHVGDIMTLEQGRPDNFTVNAAVNHAHPAVSYVHTATDVPPGETYTTRTRRDQAQTHQVELEGDGAFAFDLAFDVVPGPDFDSDGDRLPDWWEQQHFGAPTAGEPGNMAANGINTVLQAYIADLDPHDPDDVFTGPPPEPEPAGPQRGVWLRFPTLDGREYIIWYTDQDLRNPVWTQADIVPAGDNPVEWLDQGDPNRPNPIDVNMRFYRVDIRLQDDS